MASPPSPTDDLAASLELLAVAGPARATPVRPPPADHRAETDLRAFATPLSPPPDVPPAWPSDVPDADVPLPLLRRCGAASPIAVDADDARASTTRVLVVFDHRLLLHVSPADHPEEAARVRAIWARLVASGALAPAPCAAPVDVRPARFATRAEVARVHTAEHIRALLALDTRGGGGTRSSGARTPFPAAGAAAAQLSPQAAPLPAGQRFSLDAAAATALFTDAKALPALAKRLFAARGGDMFSTDFTPAAALLAAGGVLRAVDAVCAASAASAFAIVRPPGHHCTASAASGFCWLNNVALGVRHAQAAHGVARVAVLDWDVHHGDGTAAVFAGDPSVLVVSLHRHDGGGFYPYGNGGAAARVGVGDAVGHCVNVPWPAGGLGDVEYAAALERVVLPVLAEFAPDMLFVSCGFDAGEGDPLGGMRVTPRGFAHAAALAVALDPPRGVVLALEGGYNQAAIAADAEAVVRVLRAAAPLSRRRRGGGGGGGDADGHAAALRSPLLQLAPPLTPLPRHIHSAALAALGEVVAAHAPHWRCVARAADKAAAWLGPRAGGSPAGRGAADGGAWLRALPPVGADADEVCRWERVDVALLLVPVAPGTAAVDVAALARRAVAPPATRGEGSGAVGAVQPAAPRVSTRRSVAAALTSPSGAAFPAASVVAESAATADAPLPATPPPQASTRLRAADAGTDATPLPAPAASPPAVEASGGPTDVSGATSSAGAAAALDSDADGGGADAPCWKPMTSRPPDGVVVLRRARASAGGACADDAHLIVYDGFGRELVRLVFAGATAVAPPVAAASDARRRASAPLPPPIVPSVAFRAAVTLDGASASPLSVEGACELLGDGGDTPACSFVLLLPVAAAGGTAAAGRAESAGRGCASLAACSAAVREWSQRAYYADAARQAAPRAVAPESGPEPGPAGSVPRAASGGGPDDSSDASRPVMTARFADDDAAIAAVRLVFPHRDAARRLAVSVADHAGRAAAAAELPGSA